MTLLWMVYVVIVGGLLALAARALEELIRGRFAVTRWIWLGAAIGMIALAVVAGKRGGERGPAVASSASGTVTGRPSIEVASARSRADDRPLATPGWGVGASPLLRELAVRAGGAGLVASERSVFVVWSVASLLLMLGLTGTIAHARAMRRKWPEHEIDGCSIRVARSDGPALIGVLRPEIVVPEWLLRCDPEEVRLAIAHEEEHRRARDPLVLLMGALLLVAFPWNPAAWWIQSRLRLAVELDCDVRVLRRRGARRLAYGNLLLDIAVRHSSTRLVGAIPLLGSRSHLERRIEAMSSKNSRPITIRSAVAAVVASLTAFAACDTALPTAAELDALNVERAETRASELLGAVDAGDRIFIVDGVVVTRPVASAIAASEIASIEVLRGEAARALSPDREGDQVVRVATRSGSEIRADRVVLAPVPAGLDIPSVQPDSTGRLRAVRSRDVIEAARSAAPSPRIFVDGILLSAGDPRPLIVIDGVVQPREDAPSVERERIESIEVVKGAAAVTIYGPGAAAGVIHIRTKR